MFARPMSLQFNLRIRWLRSCSECHMTDISFLTESVTEVDRCCKEIVGIDLPECCLGTKFNLFTAAAYYEGVLDVAGASRVTTPRALALPHTPSPKKAIPGGPPAGGPRRRAGPRAGGPSAGGPRAGGGQRARRSPSQRRPHPRQGAKEESARAAVANKSCCA